MNRRLLKLQLHMGSKITVISEKIGKDIGAPKIVKNDWGALGTKLNIIGKINSNVSFWGQNLKDNLHVVKGIPLSIFGGDWTNKDFITNIWKIIREITEVALKFTQFFSFIYCLCNELHCYLHDLGKILKPFQKWAAVNICLSFLTWYRKKIIFGKNSRWDWKKEMKKS